MELSKKQENKIKVISGIPEQYFNNPKLNQAVALLPKHYNFQIQKTLYRIDQLKKQLSKQNLRVSLQFPQGLMLFACIISDILAIFSKSEVIILGDVTYGACCVDDIASNQLNCDLLVHYGHSCLVPITQTLRKVLYVFVQINIDMNHFIQTINFNFQNKQQIYYLMGTIQFNTILYQSKEKLQKLGYKKIIIPQQKPRSGGEVLGCTSPTLPLQQKNNNVIFLCDGRFHMQSTMIANPKFDFYQYNPYSRQLTIQKYANNEMMRRRKQQIQRALSGKTKRIAFIYGTLGRQGNPGILNRMLEKLGNKFSYFVLLVSQVNDVLLNKLKDSVDFFVQVSCPRLSIDWGYKSPKPLLTPYEYFVLINQIQWKSIYPMDYYSNNGGMWTNYFGRQTKKPAKVKLVMQKI